MKRNQKCEYKPGQILKRTALRGIIGNKPSNLPSGMVVEAVHRQKGSFLITGRSLGPSGLSMSFHVMFPKGVARPVGLRVVDVDAAQARLDAATQKPQKRGRKVEAKVESKRFLYHDSSTLATPSFAAKTVPSDERSGKRMVLADFLDD